MRDGRGPQQAVRALRAVARAARHGEQHVLAGGQRRDREVAERPGVVVGGPPDPQAAAHVLERGGDLGGRLAHRPPRERHPRRPGAHAEHDGQQDGQGSTEPGGGPEPAAPSGRRDGAQRSSGVVVVVEEASTGIVVVVGVGW